ncbi:MAG: 6,7-dimethyl-8-ribityllumazine synthase [Methylophilaceae bacterium]|jgi:6,7-dimethyl-8-ribityllumazine synthase
MSEEEIKNLSIGIVSSRFNNEIVEKISKACISKLQALGVSNKNIIFKTVPGALEIPLALQKLVISDDNIFDVMIAIGLVIRGDTYHFEIVSNESASGIMRVQLDHSIPIINAVLTTNCSKEALARVVVKGEEAAEGAIEMALKNYNNND